MRNIGILLFEEIELLDFAGPFEVFSVTNELNDHKLCETFTISETGSQIKTVNGLKIVPDYSIRNSPEINILLIPGGIGTKAILDNKNLLDWIYNKFEKSEITFSVCSGARVLGRLGLLDGLEFVTHHDVEEDVLKIAPKAIIRKGKRFTDNGKIMTSAGISAGIDLSLYIIEKLYGKSIMLKTIKYMEYGNWSDNIAMTH
jgi:transcriptional regulator GlxA family with amidase domain